MSTPKREPPDLTSPGALSSLESRRQLDEYNYEHFRPKHLLADLWRTAKGEGMQPGSEVPDFELETTEGERVCLSALRGQPVLLHFGNAT